MLINIIKYSLLSIFSLIIGCILVFFLNEDCIKVNVGEKNVGYVIGEYCEDKRCEPHYAEYYIENNNYYIFDEATGNTGKLLGEYLYEQKKMAKDGLDPFVYTYFLISKLLI